MADIKLRCDGCGMTEASLPGGYRPVGQKANHLRVDKEDVWCTGTWREDRVSAKTGAAPPAGPSAAETRPSWVDSFDRSQLEAAAQEHQRRADKLERELAAKRDECGRLERQLAEARNERDMANREAAALNQQRIRLEDELRRMKAGRR